MPLYRIRRHFFVYFYQLFSYCYVAFG